MQISTNKDYKFNACDLWFIISVSNQYPIQLLVRRYEFENNAAFILVVSYDGNLAGCIV